VVAVGRGCVDEDGGFEMGNLLGEFRGELVQALDFDLRRRNSSFEFIGYAPGETVVAAQGISVGDEEDAGGHGVWFRRGAMLHQSIVAACIQELDKRPSEGNKLLDSPTCF